MTTGMPESCAAIENMTERCAVQDRLSRAAAIAVELNDTLSTLLEQQASLRRVATLVARGAGPSEVFSAVADEMARCLQVCSATVCRYESDRSFIVAATYDTCGPSGLALGERLPLEGDNVAVMVLRDGRAVRMDSHDNARGPAAARIREVGLKCGVGAPIVVDGRLWGAAIVGSSSPQPLPDDTEARISDFADLVATAIAAATTRSELIASRARIVAAADEARRLLERDLHDGAQQRLVSLGLQLRALEGSLSEEPADVRQRVADLVSGLIEVSMDLRELSHGLHPAILSSGGLGPALKTLAHRSAIPVDVDVAIDRRLPDSVEVAAYYVVAEALTNAAKHARASEAEVSAQADDHRLYLSISDNGIGGADSDNGSGLIGLIDRVEALGGRMRVVSPLGSGTRLEATIPIE